MSTTQAVQSAGIAKETQAVARADRIQSVDVFRGLTIALMILVNNNGDFRAAYWPLLHSQWNGWTPTDLVFPFFVFIVGVSMVYSFRSRLARGDSRGSIFMHAVRRVVILFAIGVLVINSFPDHYQFDHIRIYGVLQRIAMCYLIAAVFVLWTGTRGQIVGIAACLIGYWILMRYVPVPGFGVPGRDIPLLDPDRNWVAWLDRKLLTGHLYEGTRDPEGLLSTIPAIGTILSGVLTGEWLRSNRTARAKALWMLIFGIVGLAAGKFFNIWFPINKKLWTSSYVVFTAGFALVVLALCYWVLDVRKRRGRWTMPVLVFGMNAIAAYTLSEMLSAGLDSWRMGSGGHEASVRELIYYHLFTSPQAHSANASLAYSIAFVLVCWLAMWILYRKKIFLKV
ncbi:MAG TPA: heparan-alpha-glucosaminide N-acetyltransferase domain-containing protein [Candidatus Acidoferrales bacterium]|nr:heparan-alpha-glucosaminide N-acetyltransferase domain-containing protein [Candidatus Acidoferrales bacterium]